ncbi:putative tRNA nucleotidyltransferase [Trypanosoma conorhini]|uniref:Putative tRNA nucleotidyltransferase n=1 Tax=Trypanosoma conorhini TaxID=83891 RepID=A0A422Q8M1_9TRYP|nr:putative tRNA nucleotidyltransferase [Trypanosoma conorhini]RNF26304.1 putative tRNA nucleotidyltransferase [Trypanosoma conorhini]
MLSPKRVRLDKPIAAAHKRIFAFLLCVNEERGIRATLRVAGGWVRDVLLGLHSQDIDIAIESPDSRHVSGELFAREVAAYQQTMGMASRTVSVIRVNPELSKHIETATVCVYDTPIEFCALRHDEYTRSDSRIPEVRPATPLEDALRRDFTINALFYNLHTMEVEDYTTGIEDLRRRVLRCPLDPSETFTDDPLRLLRGIRFVGQLGELEFSLDDSVMCCVNKGLLEKVTAKVSRERIGKELVKMLSGPSPERCVDLLLKMGLLQHVLLAELYMKRSQKGKFTAEVERIEYLAPEDTATDGSLASLVALNRTLTPLYSRSDSPLLLSSPSDKLVAVLFLLCLPLYRGTPREQLAERLYALCVNGLKLPLTSYNALRRMIECHKTLLQHRLDMRGITSAGVTDAAKLALFEGLSDLNDKRMVSSAFKIVLSSYLLLEQRSELLGCSDVGAVAGIISDVWSALERESGLLDAMTRPLLLKGDELSKLIPLDPPQIGPALVVLRRYAMLHPQATRDDMIAWLRKEKAAL